jgi:HPt (histidine-containing phosphotransfer) domain-containing protein
VRRSARVGRLFLGELPKRVGELRLAVAEGDAAALRQRAHTLKGSCLSVGANALAALCADLEVAPADRRGVVLERLSTEAEVVVRALRREIDEHAVDARGTARVDT